MPSSWVSADAWPEKVASLTREGWWLADLCGLDTIGLYANSGSLAEATDAAGEGARFEVVTQWLHRDRKQRVTIHVPAEGDPPAVPSIVETWPEAAFMEREAYDLMGIVFDGHEGLARLLMPEGWEGHPLRKDYGVGKIPIQWIPQPVLQVDAPGQAPDPAAAGASVDRLGQSPAERGVP
ncbi:MAG: NADH-quinone oxidoreductase subunit C [Actinomycetota bacterium]|nr:NADH-quinone oxidoreductase subunit C [Actinomycetota bacterium]